MKKNFQLFIFTLSLLIFSSNVNVKALSFDNTLLAKYVTSYKEMTAIAVDKNKEFTINFNKEINKLSINRNTIKVLNSKGQEASISIVSSIDNNKVAIVKPNQSYTEGETYALIVTKGVTDTNNKSLNKEIVLKFTVKSAAADPQPGEIINKSADELFLDSLYKKNSPYWDYGAKYVDGKLNLRNYDYLTKESSWKTLSTSFNSEINTQTMAVFKSLYTEKEGYQTCISYSAGNNNTGLSIVELYGKGLTVRGDAFVDFMFFDSVKSTDKGTSFIISIPQCTKENYNNNSYRIKNALGAAVNNSYSEQIFNYISNQYTNTVLAGNFERIVISKEFGDLKVIVNSYNKRLYAEIIKL